MKQKNAEYRFSWILNGRRKFINSFTSHLPKKIYFKNSGYFVELTFSYSPECEEFRSIVYFFKEVSFKNILYIGLCLDILLTFPLRRRINFEFSILFIPLNFFCKHRKISRNGQNWLKLVPFHFFLPSLDFLSPYHSVIPSWKVEPIIIL